MDIVTLGRRNPDHQPSYTVLEIHVLGDLAVEIVCRCRCPIKVESAETLVGGIG
jgi:hypothetical protein